LRHRLDIPAEKIIQVVSTSSSTQPCWRFSSIICHFFAIDESQARGPFSRFGSFLSPKKTQNDNQGSILAYSLFGQFLVTGRIGALLTPYFRITDIWAWNPKSPIFRGGKPALIFPFGWQIIFEMGLSRGKTGKGDTRSPREKS
jgi:hypothetical protein